MLTLSEQLGRKITEIERGKILMIINKEVDGGEPVVDPILEPGLNPEPEKVAEVVRQRIEEHNLTAN